MSATKGNEFWKLRSKHGRDKLFESSDLLWEESCKYFEWCDDNPLEEEKLFAFQGKIVIGKVNKMRAYTMNGLCIYLGCSESYFRKFKSTLEDNETEGFFTVIELIENIIYEQKYTGAAADLLNANIISRSLGLSDKIESKNTTIDMTPITKEELQEFRQRLEEDY